MEAPRLWGARGKGRKQNRVQGWCLGKEDTPRRVLDLGVHHPITKRLPSYGLLPQKRF